jgi:hypothetical protein
MYAATTKDEGNTVDGRFSAVYYFIPSWGGVKWTVIIEGIEQISRPLLAGR